MQPIDDSTLLAEIEDLLRSAPSQAAMHESTPENLAWLGRGAALVKRWDSTKAIVFDGDVRQLHAGRAFNPASAAANILTTLHQARHDLRLRSVGPLSVPVSHGSVFDYFDEVRKVLQSAQQELFIVDPYTDSEFVSRYLTQVPPHVRVRLLTRKGLASLLPAVKLLRQQAGSVVEVRSVSSLHDRCIFVDSRTGFQSGASLKDGPKNAPTLLAEITDALPAVLQTYEDMWSSATPHL
ncbi:MAG: hypothetical protein ACOY5V_06750 [Pseudomonadota bacterium]